MATVDLAAAGRVDAVVMAVDEVTGADRGDNPVVSGRLSVVSETKTPFEQSLSGVFLAADLGLQYRFSGWTPEGVRHPSITVMLR